ncbi:ubiquinol-cytochrome C reductase iron-sulfur subunit [Actinidia rufa]|uniref:Ubiquinol-cytochrome C reductase iron-sulfur subunit n=1 Tax=Actinidia rufa TaxID=165716 RepID=A0A7J0DHQ3_9ERIC|nr:ubiquinol-cytochrome C reductase iron-sulfur subunit [Actinidia rufa]
MMVVAGFASELITQNKENSIVPDIPPTIVDVKNPTSKIVYDEHNHERYPPACHPSKDVIALSSLEVDVSNIEPGSTITVKWRGRPVFIRHRTEEDIREANSVDIRSFATRSMIGKELKNQNGFLLLGSALIWVASPYQMQVTMVGGFCPCQGSHYDIVGSTLQSGGTHLHFLG